MAGSALAIVQPGDLGDEDSAQPAESTTTTSPPTDLTTSSTIAVTTTSAPSGETTTTIAGSGLGVSEPPSGGADGAAGTGGESMIGLGMALLGLGLLLRRGLRLQPA
ncbi:MAG: hypothetical protein ACOYXM_08005 [Actinomycetota bacterium]